MLIDAVLARNEVDLVKLRVSFYEGLIDRLIICESPHTFMGDEKPLVFSELVRRGELPSWVEVVVLDIPSELLKKRDPFAVEDWVRWEFLESISVDFPGARFLFQDVDEFPSIEQISHARILTPEEDVVSIPMQIFYRRINWKLARKGDGWLCSKLIVSRLDRESTGNIRSVRTKAQVPGELGAHFSFLDATPEGMESKLRTYPHQDANVPAVWNPKYLAFCDKHGLDHLGRAGDRGFGLLNYVAPERYTGPMKAASKAHPEWVGGHFEPNWLGRAIAAQIATRFKVSRGSEDYIDANGEKFSHEGWISGFLALSKVVASQNYASLRRGVKQFNNQTSRKLGRFLSLKS